MKKKSVISIIIPVYNSESYLERLLQSVINQTYIFFEVLIVDDGSTDQSSEIYNRFKKKDTRIKIFFQNNSGVSVARNLGISKANGDFIVFVDSDDILATDYLERLISVYSETPLVDLVICNYCKFYENESLSIEPHPLGNLETVILDSPRRVALLFTESKTSLLAVSVWGKLYKKEIIIQNNILFPESINYEEDCCFNIAYYRNINSAVLISDGLYYYRQHKESLSKKYTDTTYYCLINGYKTRKFFFEDLGMSFEDQIKLNNVFALVICNTYKKIFASGLNINSRIKEYKNIMNLIETQTIVKNCRIPNGRFFHLLILFTKFKFAFATDVLLYIWRKKNASRDHYISLCI